VAQENSSQLSVPRRIDPDRRVVALTGASGFLGTELIKRLERDRRYRRVLAIDIACPNARLSKTDFHKLDLTQPGADAELARIFQSHGVDTVVHLAFLTRPSHNAAWAHELEAIGTMHVHNACAACTVHKLIQWSLTALFGPHEQNSFYLKDDEAMRGLPGSRFFSDKLEAERLARRFEAENPATVVTVLRTAAILGKRVDNFVSRYFSHAVVPTLMGHDPLVQLLGEDDAVSAFKLCLDADYRGRFNIAAKGVMPLHTIIALAGRFAFPVPHLAARSLTRLLWTAQALELPPQFLDFLRYFCVVETEPSLKQLGFAPTLDIQAVVRQFADGKAEGLA